MFTFHHISLSVTNIANSLKFYEILGFKEVLRWKADDESLEIAHLKLNNAYLELFCYVKPHPAPSTMDSLETDLKVIGTRHFGLKVKSISEAKEHIIKNNIADSIEVKHGRTGIDYFFIKDPDGIFVEIVQDDRNI